MRERNPEMGQPMGEEESKKEQSPADSVDENMDYWLAMAELAEADSRKKKVEETEAETTMSELNELFDTWLTPEKLEPLHAITSVQEALASQQRKDAKAALDAMTTKIKALKNSLPQSEIDALILKELPLKKAIGALNNGTVDHTR